MTLEVDYVPFATGGGANIYTPSDYIALPIVGTGVQPGLADPLLANNAWRQSSMVAAAVANFISTTLQISVLDDGNLANLIANLTSAIQVGSIVKPVRAVSSSGAFTIGLTDYTVALNRVASVSASSSTLPAGASLGQEFWIEDAVGNFNAANVTINAPAGHNIAGLADVVLNENRQCARFKYVAVNTWTVKF